jgi:pseudouridine-5'-phosphate glycosidase
MSAKWEMGLSGGLVVANPIPEPYALPRTRIEQAIGAALDEARARGIEGKAVTPFLLERINALTGGDTLRSNVELVLNNARLGAQIAVEYAGLAMSR